MLAIRRPGETRSVVVECDVFGHRGPLAGRQFDRHEIEPNLLRTGFLKLSRGSVCNAVTGRGKGELGNSLVFDHTLRAAGDDIDPHKAPEIAVEVPRRGA